MLSPPSAGMLRSVFRRKNWLAPPITLAGAAERERPAARRRRQDADQRVAHVLGEDVDDVLRSREAGLDEREPGLHEEHQAAGDEHPDVVEDGLGVRAVLGEHRRGGDRDDRDDTAQGGDDSKRTFVAHEVLLRGKVGIG